MDEAVTGVCEYYGYRLEDIYVKRFKEGGLTSGQIEALYEHAIRREMLRQGVDPDAETKETTGQATTAPKATQQAKTEQSAQKLPLFGSPEDYAHMSVEERRKLTAKMMAGYKKWAGQQKNVGVNDGR